MAGIDPGTVSIDVCALDGGEVLLDESFRSADLALDPTPLVDALLAQGPLDLVLGPAGYGLPLVPGERVGERELGLMLLLRSDEAGARAGIGGMRAMIRALIGAGLPLVFGPGAIHLPTVPEYRKWNRIDLGTADKVCSAALCIVDQAERLGLAYEETSFIMLELGGAFSAALAIDGGQIVDGLGGSCAPIGARSCGALDAEVAYLLGAALSKETVFSGGALDPRGELDLSSPGALEALRGDPDLPRGMARARGGRGEGRARPDGLGSRRRARSSSPAAWRALPACSRRSGNGSPVWRPSRPPPGWVRAPRRQRRARPCWRTAWPEGATHRWSSGCACARRAAPRWTTCACTGPTRIRLA